MGAGNRFCLVLALLGVSGFIGSLYMVSNNSVKTWIAGRGSGVTLISKHAHKDSKTAILASAQDTRKADGTHTDIKTNLIIVTYMRSGSTLTGNMFEYNPDVFYVFEPMHELKWLWWGTSLSAYYLNMPKLGVGTEFVYINLAIRTVRNIFNCTFGNIDIATLSQNHFYRSKSTQNYYWCVRRNPGVWNLPKCIPILNEKCRKTPVRLIKTIEFPMATANRIISLDQSVKVLHLIRDPRATISSQVLIGRRTWSNLTEFSRDHCNKVLKDIGVTAELLKTSPSNTRLLRYEDLCADPVNVVRSLYEFVSLDFTDDAKKTVESFTSSKEKNDRCLYCTVRSNSTLDSILWRTNISMEHVKIIDKSCGMVYQKLGYKPVQSEKILRDLSQSLIGKINL